MGIEYKIKFSIQSKEQAEDFLKRILMHSNEEVTILLENDGFYFCDNCHNPPEIASHVFRRLVDEALTHSLDVTINEL